MFCKFQAIFAYMVSVSISSVNSNVDQNLSAFLFFIWSVLDLNNRGKAKLDDELDM